MGIDLKALPVWKQMEPVSLEEMDSIKLMNRLDTKFVTSEKALVRILEDAAVARYRVCTIFGEQLSPYHSLYYDTPGLTMYLDHHNDRKVRQKVRTRSYLLSGDSYLEIKRKGNNGRTSKKRMRIAPEYYGHFGDLPSAAAFLAEKSRFTASELKPACTTEFNRITLVNPQKTERLTIDTRMHFRNHPTGNESTLGDAVIIEIKQDGRAASKMKEILRYNHVFPYRISKYTIGTVLTDFSAKDNRFKEKIRYIEKTINSKITQRYERSL